jgi:hypothetical protein
VAQTNTRVKIADEFMGDRQKKSTQDYEKSLNKIKKLTNQEKSLCKQHLSESTV